jgi:ParB family chromosome partitioning protein
LLKLDPIIQTGMRDGFISMGHGRALITVEETSDQLDIYQQILGENLSVRQTEELVKLKKSGSLSRKPKPKQRTVPEYLSKATQNLSNVTGRKISGKVGRNGKGSISIPFNSEEDLQEIIDLLNAK